MPPTNRQQRGRDVISDQTANHPHTPSPSPSDHTGGEPPALIPFQTEPNEAGLFRIYPTRPTTLPENNTLEGVTDAPTLAGASHRAPNSSRLIPGLSSPEISNDELFEAFSNPTSGLLMAWQYSGTNQKSVAELQHLCNFIGDPLFNSDDALTFSHTRESKNVDAYLQNKANPFRKEHGWRSSTVKIHLPKEGTKWPSETDAPELEIPGVYHRSITDIIKSVFQDNVAAMFNMTPYREYWKCSEDRTVEVIGEAYSTPEMLEAYKEINSLPREAGDDLERVVASLMVWSDATHLASFGDASLWPFYLFFGNQSKYTRGKPSASACHHIAYIPTVSLLSSVETQMISGGFSCPIIFKIFIGIYSARLLPAKSICIASASLCKLSGPFSWTKSSCMPMSMASSSSVVMASLAGYSLVSLHIQLIIQRSEYLHICSNSPLTLISQSYSVRHQKSRTMSLSTLSYEEN